MVIKFDYRKRKLIFIDRQKKLQNCRTKIKFENKAIRKFFFATYARIKVSDTKHYNYKNNLQFTHNKKSIS